MTTFVAVVLSLGLLGIVVGVDQTTTVPSTDEGTTTEGVTTPDSKTSTSTPVNTPVNAPVNTPVSAPVVPEWTDMEADESDKLVAFVVAEIQKLKVEHKELDECQELELSSVLSGKKLIGKTTKYSVTLKVQPQVKNTQDCLQQNSTMTNMHPEICEADVMEGDRGGTDEKTLLRSTCLQVEELQD